MRALSVAMVVVLGVVFAVGYGEQMVEEDKEGSFWNIEPKLVIRDGLCYERRR